MVQGLFLSSKNPAKRIIESIHIAKTFILHGNKFLLHRGMTKKNMQEKTSGLIEKLLHYALGSDELFPLIEALPETSSITQNKLEYELRLLKILSVGWGLSYYLDEGENKEATITTFWQEIYLFSKEIDQTSRTAGIEIVYFSILEERFNAYRARLETGPAKDVIRLMGLACASFCGDENDSYVYVVGKKVFRDALSNLQEFLSELYRIPAT